MFDGRPTMLYKLLLKVIVVEGDRVEKRTGGNENETLNYFGMIIKALLFGIIYFIINKYLL